MAKRFRPVMRRARFEVGGYSPAAMLAVGSGLVERAIRPRLMAARDVNDAAAPPLKGDLSDRRSYLYRKVTKYGGQPIRDWWRTGRTQRSMRVVEAGPNRAVISFTDAETKRRAFYNNLRSRQFGVSPDDQRQLARLFDEQAGAVQAKAKAS